MRLAEIVRASEEVAGTSARLEKVARLAALLERLPEEDVPIAVAFLAGGPRQGKVGVGPATLERVLPVQPAAEPRLTVPELDERLEEIASISGPGSVRRRDEALGGLFSRATAREQDFLARLLLGELRQGAQSGLLIEAVAEAAGAPASDVRRAVMLRGDPGAVARTALAEGAEALRDVGIRLFRPVEPMLAQTAEGLDEALEQLGPAALEYKLDGVRLQAHKEGDDVRIFTRRLNDVTASLPEVVEEVRAMSPRELVLDGEVLSLDAEGRPRPFQVTMRRFGRREDVERIREEVPLTPFFFDCLYLEGSSLVDRPGGERLEALAGAVGPEARIPRIATADPEEAEAFLERALREGHEGVMAKSLEAPYSAGRRGKSWLKVKPAHTADLVVLAAEWGHGRREGWLSNLHLGARGEAPGDFVMVGKTFKGMTDEMLAWQTERFRELARERSGNTVRLRPELVVEVAFDGVQESPHYPGGVALRFARVKGYRPDKSPDEADSLEWLRSLIRGSRTEAAR